MHANHREDLDVVVRRRHRGRHRPQEHHDRRHAVRPRRTRSSSSSIEFPEPVIHVAVEPKTKADQDKLGKALYSLSEEDPTFQVRTDEETGQTVISGMGELHLEVLVDRMLREFSVDATVGKPQVAYRETITQDGREGRCTATSSRPVVAASSPHVVIALEPTGPGGGYEFVDKITGGASRRSTSPRSTPGIQEALTAGVLAGYPMVDVRATLDRRLVPRRRLVGDGVQDRRLDGASRKRPARPSPCCSSRSWPSRSSRPRTTWATSSATSLAAAARSRAWSSAATAR